jgi:hypothetical protein
VDNNCKQFGSENSKLFRRLLESNGYAIGFLNRLADQTDDEELQKQIMDVVIHLMQESVTTSNQWYYGDDTLD